MRAWLLVCAAGCASAAPDPGPRDLAMPIAADLAGSDATMVDGAIATGPIMLTTSLGSVPTPLAFVAGQDGDGPWTALSSSDGHYSLTVTTGRYGLFWVCPPTQATDIGGVFTHGGPVWLAATRAELSDVKAFCPARQGTAIYNGIAANAPALQVCAGAECAVTSQESFQQTVALSPPIGATDLFSGRRGSGTKLNDVKVQRDAVISTSPGAPTTLDSSNGYTALASNTLTTNAMAGDTLSVRTDWRLRNGLDVVLSIGAAGTVLAAPIAALSVEEVQAVTVTATNASAADARRVATRWFRTPATLDVQLPAQLAAVTASTVAVGAEKVMKFVFTPLTGAQGYVATVRQGGPDVATYRIYLSAGWVGTTGTVTAPSVGSMTGFPAQYKLTMPLQWSFGAYQSNKTFGDQLTLGGPPAPAPAPTLDGWTSSVSSRTGSLTP